MAVVILAVGITAVLRAFETSLVALAEARNTLLAHLLIREKIVAAELDLLEGPEAPTGPVTGSFRDFQWQLDLESLAVPDGGGYRLYRLDVAAWREGSERIYSVSTYAGSADPREL